MAQGATPGSAKNNWHALQAAKRTRKPKLWVGALTEEEGWQKRMKQHFESIQDTRRRGSQETGCGHLEKIGKKENPSTTFFGRGAHSGYGEIEIGYKYRT